MSELHIIGPCARSSLSCWSARHRCFKSQYDQILAVAHQVFGNQTTAENWLQGSAGGLGRGALCSLLCTPSGYQDIYGLLMRLDYGILG